MLDIALDYAEQAGFSVFPVAEDCKAGRLAWPDTKSGFLAVHDASRDPERISAYWSKYPDANISVACGAASGVFVLDIDVKTSAGEGFDGMADLDRLQHMHGDLPRTWATRTPSGGAHLWFRAPVDRELTNRVHFRAPDGHGGEWKTGLDIRTDGGCVPVPPSAKPTGPYVWLRNCMATDLAESPGWLLDLVDPPLPPRKPMPPIIAKSVDRVVRYVDAAVNAECQALGRMGAASGRNLRLFQASANLGELVGARILSQDLAEGALEMAAQQNGLWKEDGPHSVRATIRSGMRKGMAHPRELAR